jgi:hypothetical protein
VNLPPLSRTKSKFIERIENTSEGPLFWLKSQPKPKAKSFSNIAEIEAMDAQLKKEFTEIEDGGFSDISLDDMSKMWQSDPDVTDRVTASGFQESLLNYSKWVEKSALLERKVAEAEVEKCLLQQAGHQGIIPGSDSGDPRFIQLFLLDILTGQKVILIKLPWSKYLKMTPSEAWDPAFDWLRDEGPNASLGDRIKS